MIDGTRWRQRFSHFDRAVNLLSEPFDRGIETLSDLEQEGTIQRFEFTFELAWKTLKDFLEHTGAKPATLTPRATFKAAFAAGILEDGQVWIDMLDHRNLAAHTYSRDTARVLLLALQDRYLPALRSLRNWFHEQDGDQ